MDDPNFKGSIIFITQSNEEGCAGFIINQDYGKKLNELAEFIHEPAISLFNGGPVEKEQLYFIHRRSDHVEHGALIHDDIFLGGNFKQALDLIRNKTIHQSDIRIFIGYCGWDTGELEAEIEEGSWIITSKNNLFN